MSLFAQTNAETTYNAHFLTFTFAHFYANFSAGKLFVGKKRRYRKPMKNTMKAKRRKTFHYDKKRNHCFYIL